MNILKTGLLLAMLSGLFVGCGWLFGGWAGALAALAASLVLNLGMCWFSDRIILAAYGAEPAPRASRLRRIVSRLTEKLGMPTPRVYIIPSGTPNALAVGPGPGRAAVAATEGLLEILNDEELEAVMAHELAHVRHRDTLIGAVTAGVAGAVSLLANVVFWVGAIGQVDEEENPLSPLAMLVLAVFAPVMAVLLQLAVSRSREFHADQTGARWCGRAWALAQALRKIEAGVRAEPMEWTPYRESSAHLFTTRPFRTDPLVALWSTHPPVEERIRRLEKLAAEQDARIGIGWG